MLSASWSTDLGFVSCHPCILLRIRAWSYVLLLRNCDSILSRNDSPVQALENADGGKLGFLVSRESVWDQYRQRRNQCRDIILSRVCYGSGVVE